MEGNFAMEYQERNGTSYHLGTSDAVIRALENARATGQRIRLFLGDAETGKAWPEENDVMGHIGRSMGPRRVPLLIASSRSRGGGAILDHCIVAIQSSAGLFIYRHAGFDAGQWEVAPSDKPDYAAAVTHNGAIHARFKSQRRAANYAAFMAGQRWTF